ncbi:MAG: arginase family protein [Bacteroidota bacterium]
MKIQIIQVPYDSGQKGVRMGRGPEHFVQHHIDQTLQERGHEVDVESIEVKTPFPTENGTAFELNRLLAERVRSTVNSRRFPIVLAGNCSSCMGTLAGLEPAQLGIVWFDAHGDYNTPETTVSGFLDGMALAMATGRCWTKLATTIPGFRPVQEANVVLVGVRDFDLEEQKLMERSKIALLHARAVKDKGIREALGPVLADLRAHVQNIYVHIDLDVLDPHKTPANNYSVPDGLMVEQVEDGVRMIAESFRIPAGAITAYNPAYDAEGNTLRAGVRLIEALVSAARQ